MSYAAHGPFITELFGNADARYTHTDLEAEDERGPAPGLPAPHVVEPQLVVTRVANLAILTRLDRVVAVAILLDDRDWTPARMGAFSAAISWSPSWYLTRRRGRPPELVCEHCGRPAGDACPSWCPDRMAPP